MMNTTRKVSSDIVDAPLNQVLEQVSKSIMETQEALDKESLKITERLSGVDPEDRVNFGGSQLSLSELGFVPSFYKLTDTEVDLKLALSMNRCPQDDHALNINATTVNSQHTSLYGFDAQGASTIRAKLIPQQTPEVYENRVTAMLQKAADAQFKIIRQYVVNKDASQLSADMLERMRLENVIADNLPEYRTVLAQLEPDNLPDMPSLQGYINRTNAMLIIRAYAEASDARAMTVREVFDTGVTGSIERNLKGYRRRVESVSTIVSIDDFSIIIHQVNALYAIRNLIEISALASLSIDMLENAGVNNLNEANLVAYHSALASIDINALDTFDLAALQVLVNKANA